MNKDSKGLEALENICNQCEHYQYEKGLRPKQCPFNKNCVFKKRIEKELKALEIIKRLLIIDDDRQRIDVRKNVEMSDEEYDLLKEVLK